MMTHAEFCKSSARLESNLSTLNNSRRNPDGRHGEIA